jgi:hypothetical protein
MSESVLTGDQLSQLLATLANPTGCGCWQPLLAVATTSVG